MTEVSASLLRRLWRQLSPVRKRQFRVVAALTLIGGMAEVVALGAVVPFLAFLADPATFRRFGPVSSILNNLQLSSPEQILIALTAAFALAAVAAGTVRVWLARTTGQFVFALAGDLGTQTYSRVLHQPYSFHVLKNSSEVLGAVAKIDLLAFGVLLPLLQSASSLVMATCIVGAILVFNPVVALCTFAALTTMYAGIYLLNRRTLRSNSALISATQPKRIQEVQEGLGGIRDVILDSTQVLFTRKFAHWDEQFRRAQARNIFIAAAPRFIIEAAGMVVFAVLALIMSLEAGGISAALPVLGILALGAQRLLPLIQLIYFGWTRVIGNAQLLNDVLGFLEMPTPSGAAEDSAKRLAFRQNIELDSVSFSYVASQPPLLREVSFAIPKGARVGLVGKTGSGKTTLSDLIMGLLKPSSGCIRIDSEALDDGMRAQWQRQVAHVPQNIFLSDATILENIAFGVDPLLINETRVEEAARQARLGGFIQSLPVNYRTMVGERGVRLSGGQRQRIGIARALYKDAQLLVFDEATNALDVDTETEVMAAIEGLGRELTVLIIAHRLSTLSFCDIVIRIDQGCLQELSRNDPVLGEVLTKPHHSETSLRSDSRLS